MRNQILFPSEFIFFLIIFRIYLIFLSFIIMKRGFVVLCSESLLELCYYLSLSLTLFLVFRYWTMMMTKMKETVKSLRMIQLKLNLCILFSNLFLYHHVRNYSDMRNSCFPPCISLSLPTATFIDHCYIDHTLCLHQNPSFSLLISIRIDSILTIIM